MDERTIYKNTARSLFITVDTALDVTTWTLKLRFGRLTGVAAVLTLNLVLSDPALKIFSAAYTATQSGALTEGPIQGFVVRTNIGTEDHLGDDWFEVKDMVLA